MNVFLYLITFLAVNPAFVAEIRTWDGEGGDNQWTTAANWDNDLVPEIDADVMIPKDDTVYVPSGIYTVESITLSHGADLIIQSGATLTTTSGGPSGSDGVRLVGAIDTITTLTVSGMLNITHGNNATGDGLDINSYCITRVTSGGHLNIQNAAGDGIEVGDVLINEGLISVHNSGSNGINSSGTVIGGSAMIQNSGQITISGNVENGLRLIADISMVNNGILTAYNNGQDAFTSSSGKLTNNGTFHASGRVKTTHFIVGEGSLYSIFDTNEPLEFNQGIDFKKATLSFDINGPTALDYDQMLISGGGIDLDTTTLELTGSYVPAINDVFLIIDKITNGGVGTQEMFMGLPEGASLTFNGVLLYITYQGGDDNDVALVVNNAYLVDNDNDGSPAFWDCNDNDDTINPGLPEIPNNAVDENCDGLVLVIDEDMDNFNSDDDCDDNDATVYPGAPELCDGKDNDCNMAIDDASTLYTYYLDADNDGYGLATDSIVTCEDTPVSGFVVNSSDCNDNNATIYEGAPELCDGFDNNCDGMIDEGLSITTYFEDADNDGYGNAVVSMMSCQISAPTGYSADNTDCDDTNDAVYPGSPEVCDNLDNDCNNDIDDGLSTTIYYEDADDDGYGNLNITLVSCSLTPDPGYSDNSDDCDDTNPDINPGAMEIPNNDEDEDCDGIAQVIDMDMDGSNSDNDCDDNNDTVYPGAPEVCDGLDNNCNGTIDDGLIITTYYVDADNDGFGDGTMPLDTCWTVAVTGYADNGDDCDDSNVDINPDAPEIPNNDIDENCDDEVFIIDEDNDGYNSDEDCDDDNANVNPGALEEPYNGIDDDCNPLTLDDDLDEDGFNADEDCNDDNADINPDADEEPYNGIDEDCDPLTLDDDLDQDGFDLAEDCNDNDATINTDADEIPNNGIDEDCDGEDLIIGLERVDVLLVSVSPNPTNGLVNIESDQFTQADLIITDVLGRELQRQSFNEQSVVDMSNFADGIYWLTIKDEQRIYQQKLIKE